MDERMDILYLRLSKEDGDAEDGSIDESCSIQAQRTCIKQYLRSKGFSVEHFSEIIDDGYSGTTTRDESPDKAGGIRESTDDHRARSLPICPQLFGSRTLP